MAVMGPWSIITTLLSYCLANTREIRVLFPEPATPVTTVIIPRGMSTSTCFRLWRQASRTGRLPVGLRGVSFNGEGLEHGPASQGIGMKQRLEAALKYDLPAVLTGQGPTSMMWSAMEMTSRSCSTTRTVLPLSRSFRSRLFMRWTSRGCIPALGSSKI